MNFPESQKTGALAEIRVEALFLQWGWATGTDRIDVGYDLCVQPDKVMFRGHRFLVQVKGTSTKKKGEIVAPVSKSRLRDYHFNQTPVFIVRSTQDGSLYWIHAQEWTRANEKRLQGNGTASVKLPRQNVLMDREMFGKKLLELFMPLAEKSDSLAELAKDRSAYLSSIDTRLDVKVGTQEGQTTYRFSAKGDDVEIPFELTPTDTVHGLQSLNDAIGFGVPLSVDLTYLRVTGSPVFEELQMNQSTPAKLEMAPVIDRIGSVSLHPGPNFNMLATELQVPANLYFGTEGAAIRTTPGEAPFSIEIRAYRQPQRYGHSTITLGLHAEELRNQPLREIKSLFQIQKWAEEALTQNGFHLTATFAGRQVAKWERQNLAPEHRDFLRLLSHIGKLHQIARALESDIVFDPDNEISPGDISTVRIAHQLLKGEVVRISAAYMALESDAAMTALPDGAYRAPTLVTLAYGDKSIGKIPVSVELCRYRSEYDQTLRVQHFYPAENSSAYLQFDKHRSAGSM